MQPNTSTTGKRPSLRIEELAITNFRTFRARTVIPFVGPTGEADAIAVFHGDNGSGKSNALAALDLFFQAAVLALRQSNDEGDILLSWDSAYAASGQSGGRDIVVAYRDRPDGSEGPTVLDVRFADARLGRLRVMCTPSGDHVRIQLVRALPRRDGAPPENDDAFTSIAHNERDQLVTWLLTPSGPTSRPLVIVDARRHRQWAASTPHASLMPPELATLLFHCRTSRQPATRAIWRAFVMILKRFAPFVGKEISVELKPPSDVPEVIVEEQGRTVLALDELSSGEQQVVVLWAASLLAESAILAVQEPEISIDHANQRLLAESLRKLVAMDGLDQIILESHVPAFDGPNVIRFSRDETGATCVRREPSRDEAAREIERRAKEQAAEQRWVTRDGYTQLPDQMRKDLKVDEDGHVWFLKGTKHWEAWPEADVEELFGGPEHDG